MRAFVQTVCALLFIIATQFWPGSATAATFTTYTNLSAWQAAAGPSVVEDFSDTTLIPGLSIKFGTWFPPGSIAGGVYSDVAVSWDQTNNPIMTYAPGTKAFGADWDLTPFGLGDGIQLHVFIGGTEFIAGTLTPTLFPDPTFFGFVSDTIIDQIFIFSVFSGEESFTMDNARFATGAAVIPLPASLPLFAGGLGMMAWWARRKKRAATIYDRSL